MLNPPPRSVNYKTPQSFSITRQFIFIILTMLMFSVVLTYLYTQASPNFQHAASSTIIIDISGVRPDMISQAITPNIYQVGQNGVIALNHHSIFPNTYLAATAALATGDYPGTFAKSLISPPLTNNFTGIYSAAAPVAKPQIGSNFFLPLSAPNIADLIANETQTSVSLPPTLAAKALAQNINVSIQGSMNNALLQGLTLYNDTPANIYIMDSSVTYPASLQSVTAPLLSKNITYDQYLTQAYIQDILPKISQNGALFLSELQFGDTLQAMTQNGVGSQQMNSALAEDDANVAAIIAALNTNKLQNSVNIIITSDHGMLNTLAANGSDSSANTQTDIAQMIANEAAKGDSGALPQVGIQGVTTQTLTANTTLAIAQEGETGYIYMPQTPALAKIARGNSIQAKGDLIQQLIPYLLSLPQVSMVFVNDAAGEFDGAIPFSAVGLNSPSAPMLLYTLAAFPQTAIHLAQNIQEFTGAAYSTSLGKATFGGISERDLRAIFFAEGPGFKQGYYDSAPTGITDIAPTAAALLNIPAQQNQAGRTLDELLAGSAFYGSVSTDTYVAAPRLLSNGDIYVAVILYQRAGSTTYIEAGGSIIGAPGSSAAKLQTQLELTLQSS